MRPLYLEFCGINSFSEPAKINFAELLRYGLFGIFGDTGSGKSTILDCVSFALYGGTPRVRAGSADLINYRCDRAYVIFEFEIFFEGERKAFRVERELKRKNSAHSVKIVELGKNLVRAEGVREAKALIEEIVGLEQKDFEKCIALPQGEFARFVKEQRSERLKIVSRLFDLEEYGEKLIARANAAARDRAAAWTVAKARLEPYEGESKEKNDALAETVAALEKEELGVRATLEEGRKRESEAADRYKKYAELSKVRQRLALLKEREEEIAALERDVSRLAHAQEVSRARAELAAARRARGEAEARLSAANKRKTESDLLLRELALWDGEKADEEIAALTEQRARAEQNELTEKRRRELAERLAKTRRAYAAEAENFKDFSYEEERAAIEKELSALGNGDFASFADDQIRAALLRGEYAVFADELGRVLVKYPETEEDVSPLVQKYSRLSEGEKKDAGTVRAQFEEREKRRRAAQEARIALEQRNGRYVTHRQSLQQLQTEGLRLREELESLASAQPAEGGSREELDRLLAQKKGEKREKTEERERARKNSSLAAAEFAAAQEKLNAAETACGGAEERLRGALGRGGFSSPEEAEELCRRFGNAADGAEKIGKFREELAALTARERDLAGEESPSAEEDLLRARTFVQETEETLRGIAARLVLGREELARGQEALAKKKELAKEESRLKREAETAERLKKLFEGNHFMEFIAEEYLQSITGGASARLLSLSSGQYFLRYDGGFWVGDNLNGGALRGVHTLSGGETFLVSLSLALSLSAEICAKSSRPIEFFFLDEGFGTLDSALVDAVMDSLEKLKSEHFAIGVISHVEELKHRVERKILVEKATDRRGSQIHA